MANAISSSSLSLSDESTEHWQKVRKQARSNVARRGQQGDWTSDVLQQCLDQLGLNTA
jgi:predicted alpha/beta hydrolase family esterase